MLSSVTKDGKKNHLSAKFSWIGIVLLWTFLIGLFFWPVFQGKVLAPLDILDSLLKPWATEESIQVHNAFTYDAISQYVPYNWSIYQSLRQDGYIGWYPYAHNGAPILENTMLCPGDWHNQLYRWLPFWDSWNLGIVLQFLIAGLGMLLFLRREGLKSTAALLGAISFGFASQFITWYSHRWVLGALCWAPWMLWAAFRAFRRHLLLSPLLCIFTALAFRGGHLQACLFVAIITGTVFLVHAYGFRHDRRMLFRIAVLFFTTVVFTSLLCLDVWMETIPAYLARCKQMPFVGVWQALKSTPTLVSLLFPFVLGTPDALNCPAFFASDLFDELFIGTAPFILGTMALFRKDAPAAAKALYLVGLILPQTPAVTWLYHRVTPVFALGCAWLAVWMIRQLSLESRNQKLFRKLLLVYIVVSVGWLAFSVLLEIFQPRFVSDLTAKVVSSIPPNKLSRADWIVERTLSQLYRLKMWQPENLAVHLLLLASIILIFTIHARQKFLHLCIFLLLIATFSEIYLYSRTWITFSDPPQEQNALYKTPPWVETLRTEAGNGSVVIVSNADFDYMQLNTPGVYGIRFQNGYETVPPPRCAPLRPASFDPDDYARAGVSLILCPPSANPTNVLEAGWPLVHESAAFRLYRNPVFQSRITAFDGEKEIPLSITGETANTRVFSIPAHTQSVHIGESFNKGWTATLADGTTIPVEKSGRYGMTLVLPAPLPSAMDVQMRFVPAYRTFYRSVIFATLAVLVLLSFLPRIFRRLDKSPLESASKP
ncbi:MAG: hypothetical protein ACI4QT_00455 [Kiritimatiellia bacterium]